MAVLSTVPEVVDVTGYAGDDLPIQITVEDPLLTQGCTWAGEVRSLKDSVTVDATFAFTLDGSGGATAVLTGAQTRALSGVVATMSTARAMTIGQQAAAAPRTIVAGVYTGVYDIQVSKPGFTRTLVQGKLTIDLDVTRPGP